MPTRSSSRKISASIAGIAAQDHLGSDDEAMNDVDADVDMDLTLVASAGEEEDEQQSDGEGQHEKQEDENSDSQEEESQEEDDDDDDDDEELVLVPTKRKRTGSGKKLTTKAPPTREIEYQVAIYTVGICSMLNFAQMGLSGISSAVIISAQTARELLGRFHTKLRPIKDHCCAATIVMNSLNLGFMTLYSEYSKVLPGCHYVRDNAFKITTAMGEFGPLSFILYLCLDIIEDFGLVEVRATTFTPTSFFTSATAVLELHL
ncbi:hypothetical protein B0H13DRAFT_1851137 [Mycena leptocephala]|nr:hypothetical protein B0H13DRAFT_1851137 [Mycena leptocephala]